MARAFKWMGLFIQWVLCPVFDVLAWLLCLFAILAPFAGDLFSFLTWLWNFLVAMFQQFNVERTAPAASFDSFLTGFLWGAIQEFFSAFRSRPVLGWLYDYGIRAMIYWNTFLWALRLIRGDKDDD